MKKIVLLLSILFFAAGKTTAQYVMAGKIEYERKANVHAQMKDLDGDANDSWYERMMAETPKFMIAYFDLTFNRSKSMYKPGREVESKSRMFSNEPASDNIVYTDLTAKKVTAIKSIYEDKFVVQDTMRNMVWRLKDEIRTISGYKCRKAVGVICDSVYVVAFYAEDIAASSGPEMFGNLPGMILELAVPRLHTTWTATKVELMSPPETDFALIEKGKKVNSKQLAETVQKGLKDWGKWGNMYKWLTAL